MLVCRIFFQHTVLPQSSLLGISSPTTAFFLQQRLLATFITQRTVPRPRRTINRRHATLDGANTPAEPMDYSAMSTKALRLTLGEHHLQQTGNRRELISRLQQNEQQRPPTPQSGSGPSNSNVATGVPNAELAALIASIVDERMNCQLTQDGGANHCNNDQLARPSPPSNLESHRSSPPPPPQDGGQNTTRQLPPSLQSLPTGNHLLNTAVPSGLTASPADLSDPAQVASFHPNF